MAELVNGDDQRQHEQKGDDVGQRGLQDAQAWRPVDKTTIQLPGYCLASDALTRRPGGTQKDVTVMRILLLRLSQKKKEL